MHCLAGAAAGLAYAGGLLWLDIGGLGTLLSNSGDAGLWLIALAGGALSFAPVFLPGAVLALGEAPPRPTTARPPPSPRNPRTR